MNSATIPDIKKAPNDVYNLFGGEMPARDPQYERLLAHIWIGVILSTLLLSFICCMCSCLLYHRIQQWKRSDLPDRDEIDIPPRNRGSFDCESLPSYTVASGLPSYEEAVHQLEMSKN